MLRQVLIDKVDHLSSVLVHIQGFDREMMGELSDWFANLSKVAAESYQQEMAAVSQAAARVLENMISEDTGDNYLSHLSLHRNRNGRVTGKSIDKVLIKQLLMEELELIELEQVPVGEMIAVAAGAAWEQYNY